MKKNLTLRLAVAFISLPLTAILIAKGGLYFFIPLIISSFITSYESYLFSINSFKIKKNWINYFFIIVTVFVILLKTYFSYIPLIYISLVIFVFFFYEVIKKNPVGFSKRAFSFVFPTIYISWGFSHIILLRMSKDSISGSNVMGVFLVILVFTIAWLSDSFAYIFGSILGKKKLIPSISPKKTIVGSIFGVIGSLIGVVIIKFIQLYYFKSLHLPWFFIILIGFIGGISSQIGDLFESIMKRDAKVTESSKILPGHGGLLDKFDSVFFASFIVYFLFKFIL